MKKTNFKLFTALFVLTAFFFVGTALAEKKDVEKKPQTVCPLMGGKINKDIYTDYQGQRVYFCCAGCKPKFEKDPEKSMKKFEKDNILLESVQTTCPVMGGEINKDQYTDYKGRRIYFCCAGCPPKFDKDPEKYLEKMDKAVKKKAKEKKCKGHGKHDH